MKQTSRRREGKGAIELIEEAVHLLRSTSAPALAAYYLGSLPFVFGFLFFCADMTRSPFAAKHVVEASLGVSVLFIWMKFWQAIFAIRIRAQFSGAPAPSFDFDRCRRILLSQLTLQPTGLFLLPLAAIPALPLAWVYAFYQNLTALADTGPAGVHSALKQSYRQAALWPRQNHVVLAYMSLFGFFVFLNLAITCLFIPDLVKMLFGIESVFTRGGGYTMLNTTFFTTLAGITYLCVDPILKTAYTLRCFYGDSVESGEDLKAELKLHALQPQRIAVALGVALLLAGTIPACAATDAPAATPPPSVQTSTPGVSPAELDRVIDETIQHRKYIWRLPRDQTDATEESGVIARFFQKANSMLRTWTRATLEWINEWLRKLFQRKSSGGGDSGYGWLWSLKILLYALLAVIISTSAILLIRWWRNRNRKPETVLAQAVKPALDLTDENIGADQLPEDCWTRLARELLARGEFRLALRAFYLASLAHLAEKNLISLARFKSNRDYELELRRRAHALPQLLPLFSENVSVFDRSWYGAHEVTDDLVNHFAANVERIKSAG